MNYIFNGVIIGENDLRVFIIKEMEETRDDNPVDEPVPPISSWCDLDFMKKLQEVSLVSLEEASTCKDSKSEHDLEGLAARKASQTLWVNGKLSEPIPNGFYSILSESRLKGPYDIIPSLDELYTMDSKGIGLDVVIVDMRKDKKLSMLKQLTLSLVKGLYSNPVAVIKKIAGLVFDFYKQPNVELNHVKDTMVEGSDALDNQGIQMLGQMRHGYCHPRAILFKFLADAVGVDSKLIVGLPREGVMERTDSYKHMSVLVVLNSVETLVDLGRHPGQLVPCSTKAIFMSHIFVAGESDSPENDSCDSPLESTSPLCSFSDRLDFESVCSTENDESPKTSYQHRLEAAVDISGPSMRKIMSKTTMNGKLNLSHSEPYVPNAFWERSRKNVIAEQGTASSSTSSPEHSLMQGRGRSILGLHRDSFMEFGTASRSAGASPITYRRRRRHSICMIPEIGDDVVRVVRAINETLKHLPREVNALTSSSAGEDHNEADPQVNGSDLHTSDHDEISGVKSTEYTLHSKKIGYQKAISLPSSPHKRSGAAEYVESTDMISTWNKLLESSKILYKPLLPYPEWNIDFSELIFGSRVGIGFFGEVFRGNWNGTEVAIKVLLEQELTVENIEDFCNEISILSYFIPWCLHIASPLVHGYGVYGNGITILSGPCEWAEKETQLA